MAALGKLRVFFRAATRPNYVIADEIVQREAIVRGYEVDACRGSTAKVIEYIAGGAQTRRQSACAYGALPEVPAHVPESVIPLGPAGRKGPDLIAAGSAIPRLRDQLDRAERRILAARLEKAALVVKTIRLAVRIVPRSNRKPSTCSSLTQYRRLSMTILMTAAWDRFNVLPVPVSLM